MGKQSFKVLTEWNVDVSGASIVCKPSKIMVVICERSITFVKYAERGTIVPVFVVNSSAEVTISEVFIIPRESMKVISSKVVPPD